MKTLLILASLSLLISTWFLIKKPSTRFLEKVMTILHFSCLLLLIGAMALLSRNLRLAGQYTNTLIAITFLLTGIILFGLTTNKAVRVYSGLIAIPTLITEISFLFGATPFALPAFVAFFMFAPPLHNEIVTDEYKFEVYAGGLMAPPNLFYLIHRKGLLDKKLPLSYPSEFYGTISDIEIISFTEGKYIVCKILGDKENEPAIDTLTYGN